MTFELGKKESSQAHFTTNITDKDEIEEIMKISPRLEQGEVVVVTAKQSRMKPGGSKVSPDSIFVTDRHLIIRNPSMMGMREKVWIIDYDKISSIDLEKGVFSSTLKIFASGYHGDIDAIDKTKAEQIITYAKTKMAEAKKSVAQTEKSASIADELGKLAKLKEQGAISEQEFQQMKQELMKKTG
ncbi:MAG TPA: PH domain-containing protein [Nitrososphaera sp.]|jgi:hypothetical protein